MMHNEQSHKRRTCQSYTLILVIRIHQIPSNIPHSNNSHQIRKLPHIMRGALITPRIPIQVQLMILLRIPPLPRLQHLRRHLPLIPLLVHLPRHRLRFGLLLGGMPKYRAAILTPRIHALAIFRGGVVHAVEKCQERGVAHLLRVEDHLEGFRVARATGADGAVGGVGGVAADVAHFCVEEALPREGFAEEVLDAPEAARGDSAFLGVVGDGGGCTMAAGVEGHGGGGCEGAEEAGEEVWHCGGHC